jgi:hypothetical protein
MVRTTPKCVLVNVITAELSASQKDVWSNQSKRLTAVIRIKVASHAQRDNRRRDGMTNTSMNPSRLTRS